MRSIGVAVLVLVAVTSVAQATTILPGQSIGFGALVGITPATDPALSGAVVFSGNQFFDRTEDGSGGGSIIITDLEHIRGHLATSIIATPGTGLLIFSNQLIIDDFQSPFSNTGYPSYSLSGFAGFNLDIFLRSDVTPIGFDVSRSGNGDVLKFTVPGTGLVSGSGPLFVIKTNALGFDTDGQLALDTHLNKGDKVVVVNGVVSPGAVPEPASSLLLIVAIIGLGFLRRNRKSSTR